ncbi:MAG: aldo/keto reductase [Deltaproteobacteria bacterium]|nr:aldo/keto reductase [Deltaproteobacteria bacterium]
MTLSLDSAYRLNNGVDMPVFGLGVWQAKSGGETRDAVLHALELGYRHIDTAKAYGNEADVGAAVRSSGVPRASIFVTTKLWNSDHGYDQALTAFDRSLAALDIEYVDLFLIHWPVEGLRHESWRALERILSEGRCRAVGVSNYTVRHLEELMGRAEVIPAVNQVEFHPFLYQRELLGFCHGKNIRITAYSPLARGRGFNDKTLKAVAKKHGKTPAQIMIRWALEHETVVIPKSVHPERLRENAEVFNFALDADDMARLDAMEKAHRVAWDPTTIP